MTAAGRTFTELCRTIPIKSNHVAELKHKPNWPSLSSGTGAGGERGGQWGSKLV